MSDIRNGQRLRLWDGSKDFGFAGVADADNDGGLYVRQHDGVNLLSVPAEDAPVGAGRTGLMLLGVRDDGGGTRVDTDGDAAALSITATGELRVTTAAALADDVAFVFGTTGICPAGWVVDDVATNVVAENNVAAARIAPNRIILTHIADPTTDTQRLAISAGGAASVNLSQVLGATHSATNPVFVTEGDPVASGNEVHDEDTQTVAKDATLNHDYVAVATFLLEQIVVAGSGAAKWIVTLDPLGVPVVILTTFTSGGQLSKEITLARPVEVTIGVTIRIEKRNDDNAAQDLYSTMVGVDA